MVVVFFSRAGENYEVGEVTVGNTAKLAQEVARRTDSPMIEIARTEPYPERYAATSEMVQEEQRVNARPLFTLSGDVDALDSSDTVFLGYPIWCGDRQIRSIDSQSTSIRSVCFSTPSSWSRRILVSMPPA